MTVVRVFDPAMCCSSGVCGPSVDPKLARFSADLDWLKQQGVSVERFNLAQQPAVFAEDPTVRAALEAKGEAGLPVVKVDGAVKISGEYPSRADLAAWAGLGKPTARKPIVLTPSSQACCTTTDSQADPASSASKAGSCC